jgi:hypothetical protein
MIADGFVPRVVIKWTSSLFFARAKHWETDGRRPPKTSYSSKVVRQRRVAI